MTRPFPLLLSIAFAVGGSAAGAQARSTPDSTRSFPPSQEARVSAMPGPVRTQPAGIRHDDACTSLGACRSNDAPPVQDAAATRGRYVLAGFLVGAGAGWLVYSRACADEDCMSSFGGILLGAAGGLLGMVVGLLLAPSGD